MHGSKRLGIALLNACGLLVLFGVMVWAADDPPAGRMAKYLRDAQAKRDADIAKLDELIDDWTKKKKLIEKSPVRPGVSKDVKDGKPGVYPSLDRKLTHVQQVQATLERWDKKRKELTDSSLPDPSITSLRVGEFGRLPAFEVTQVVDDDTMLVEVERLGTVLIRGVPTEGIADDKRLWSDKFYDIVGTESFKTVLGAKRTVYVVRPFVEKKKDE